MTFLCATFVALFALVSLEVITILDTENITCVLTEESVYSALYIWPPIHHQNGSVVNVKRPIVEIDEWRNDDWNLVKKKDFTSLFAPVTDIRWEAYDLATANSFKNEEFFSVSVCNTSRINNSFVLNKDLFVSPTSRKATGGKEFCSWVHYSVSTDTIVKNIQDKTWTEWRQSGNNSNFDIHVLSANDIVKFHKNQFRFSETETTHPGKKSYINLINVTDSTTICIAMFVAVDKLCQLDVAIESGGKLIINKTIFGFNDVFSSAIKYWKRVEIKFSYHRSSAKLLFLRRKPYSSYHCFWAIDCIHLCKSGIDIYQISRPANSRQDHVCTSLDNRNNSKREFCNNIEYLDTSCKLKCKDVMGDNYPYCASHKICLENGDCKCASGRTNTTCPVSSTFKSHNDADAFSDDQKSCTAHYSTKELIFWIFFVLVIEVFIGCSYYIYKKGYVVFSRITKFCRPSGLSEKIQLSQREQLLDIIEKRITKLCILEDFALYNPVDSSKTGDVFGNGPLQPKNSGLKDHRKSNIYNTYKVQMGSKGDNRINEKCINLKTYIFYKGFGFGDDFMKMIIQEKIETVIVASNEIASNREGALPSDHFGKVETACFEYYNMVTYKFDFDKHQREIIFYYINWSSDDVKCLRPNKICPIVKRLFELSKSSTVPIMIKSNDNNLTETLIVCDLALQTVETKNTINFCELLKKLRKQRPNIITDQKYYILAHLTVFEYLLEEQYPPSISVIAHGWETLNKFLIHKQSNSKSTQVFWTKVAQEHIECILFVDPLPDQLWPCITSDTISKIKVKKLSNASEDHQHYYLNRVLLKVIYTKNSVSSLRMVGLFKLHDCQPKSLLETVRDIQRTFPGKRILISYRTSITNTLLVVALLSFGKSIPFM